MNLLCWVNATDSMMLKDFVESTVDSVKCSTMNCMTGDNEQTKEYGRIYEDLIKTFGTFLLERKDTILNWTGSGDGAGAEAFINSGASAPAAPVKKVEEVKKADTPAQ